MVAYSMFVVRDTGAKHYFPLPLVECYGVCRQAHVRLGSCCRTVQGPSITAEPGKVQSTRMPSVQGEIVIALQFIQVRNPEWVLRSFFARYDEPAT